MATPFKQTLNLTSTAGGVVAVVLVCGLFSFGARKVFPLWDDGWLWLLLEEKGLEAIEPSHPERPLAVWLWSLLAPSKAAFWRNAWLAQVILWPTLALLSWRLWWRMVPSRRQWGGAIALTVVLPTVTQVQMLTANVALASLLSVVLGYAAVVSAFEALHSTGWPAIAWGVVGLVALVFGVLHQEYAVAVAAVGTVLLWYHALMVPNYRMRAIAAGAVVAVVALGSYGVYLTLADFGPGSRPALNPQQFLGWQSAGQGLAITMAPALWQGLAGAWLNALDRIADSEFGWVSSAFGGIITALVLFSARLDTTRGSHSDKTKTTAIVAFLCAVIAGLAPAIIAGEFPWNPANGVDSRFGLPAVVPLAMLLVYLLTSIRFEALRLLVVATFVFVPSAAAVADVRSGIREANRVARYGRCLQPVVELSNDITVAVVPSPVRPWGPARQWELTARLARAMPLRGLSHRIWAHREGGGPSLGSSDTAYNVYGSRDRCTRRRAVRAAVRNLDRRGPLARVVRVEESKEARVGIESYCLSRRGRVAFRSQCADAGLTDQ